MDRPRLFVELCAGSAAVSLRLVGGPNANPPIGYMGGKRGYARAILGVLGLRQGLGAQEVWLNDPGPWGPVWRVLTTPGKAEEVAAIIRGWKDEEPRALWERLKAQGWGELTEVGEVAACLALVGGSFSHGAEKLSIGPNFTGHPGSDAFGAKEPITVWLASRVEAVARWLVCGAWSHPGSNAFNKDKAYGAYDTNQAGNWSNRAPDTPKRLASRLTSWPTPVRTFTGSALEVPIPEDCEGVYLYADPPYQGTTGYQHDLPRDAVLEVAERWADAGAVVCISEAEPLPLDGWHHVEITSERKGQKRTFSRQQGEWLTMNREPAWRPSVQVGLFG